MARWPASLRAWEESSITVGPRVEPGRTQGSQWCMSAAGSGRLLTHRVTKRESADNAENNVGQRTVDGRKQDLSGPFPWLLSRLCSVKRASLLKVGMESIIQ